MRPSKATRIVVVEDEAVIAMDLRERLAALGYEVCGTATHGEAALRIIAERSPDLVLMDVNLAGAMDGVEVAQKLGERCGVPIVFLTAYADPELIARVSVTSSYGYLVKPFEERELHATLQVALARASANALLESRVAERTRELRDALAEMESVSYCIAHDLRTPLRALSSYSTLLAREHAGSLNAEAAQMLGKIDASARHMDALIGALLELAHLGHKTMRRQPVAMRRLAQEALRELGMPAGEGRVETRIGDMPDALGDPILMGQVWRNLLANALKYSAGRDPAVIEAGFDAESGAWFVRDNGVGFDMRYSDKLFRPFSRLHGSDEFEGIGIGLAHAARIVRRHDGRIWAEAEPGKGAAFRFVISKGST